MRRLLGAPSVTYLKSPRLNALPDQNPPATVNHNVLRWGAFFALAYAIQGFSQTATLFVQPIQYYYKTAENYNAAGLARILFLLGIPWYLKPFYGLISDFIPLFGFRRKSYLLLLSLLATLAFALIIGIHDARLVFWLLMLSTVSTAMGDVLVDGLMIEEGQKSGRIKLYQGLQWTAIYITGFAAVWLGGVVVSNAQEAGTPGLALRQAAMLALAGPAIMFVLTWLMVKEPKSRLDVAGLGQTLKGMKEAGRSMPLWGAALFLCCFWFQPGMVSPMYIHITEVMGIGEAFYAKAGAWAYLGYILGALVFLTALGPFFSIRKLAVLSIALYAMATLAYLFLVGPKTLVTLNILISFANAIANLTLLSLAAQVCPRRVEAFVFAALMAMLNFSRNGSEWVGGKLYAGVLDGNIQPLIVISAAVTALTVLLIPLLPKKDIA